MLCSIRQCRLLSLLIVKAYVILKHVLKFKAASSIIWVLQSSIYRSTLAGANEQRDWRIYADFAQTLIKIVRPLYAGDELGMDLKNTVYALDASKIDLCFLFSHGRSFDQRSLPLN